ncbi:MAG: YiiD C-terminal domain-containing protein [Ktedonobacterales bacterium]
MLDVEGINRLLDAAVPFSRAVGAQVVTLEPEFAEAVLPELPERLNHVGTVHAVAQFGVGEVASGALISGVFADMQAQGYAPIVAEATIRYLRPARGELRASARFAAAEQARVRDELRANGKARFTIAVRIVDASETVTTELEVNWALIKPR